MLSSRRVTGEEIILKFLQKNPLLAFDFDGTLAPIVRSRTKARMRAGTRKLLRELTRSYTVGIVTGRSVRDAKAKCRGAGRLLYVGNHGAEVNGRRFGSPAKVRAWKRHLAQALLSIQGIDIEDKTFSLSVHYIKSKDKARAREAILAALSSLKGAKIVSGKNVFNVVDPKAPGKGGGLLRLMKQTGHRRAIFVGDDVTDEDAFRLNRRKVLSIKIGERRGSRAKLFLKSQREIDRLLSLMHRGRASAP